MTETSKETSMGECETHGQSERLRNTPSINSPHINVRQTANAGLGVFAKNKIPPNTSLLKSSSPAAYVIYRQFRKEVCAWCFRYERGRNWKVRLGEADFQKHAGERSQKPSGEESQSLPSGNLNPKTSKAQSYNSGGMVFDSELCKQKWLSEYGVVGLESYLALEDFVQKQSRKVDADDATGEPELKDCPSIEQITEAWESIEDSSYNIREHRIVSNLRQSSETSILQNPLADHREQKQRQLNMKRRARAVANVLSSSVPDPDLLFFLLSGILCKSNDLMISTGEEITIPSRWSNLLNLAPASIPYTSLRALRWTTRAYQQLLAVLPVSLLQDSRLVNKTTVEAILARDIGNSFGIWSVNDSLGIGQLSKEDPEMLGYAIYPTASFFNHSCAPNLHKQRIGRSWVFSSTTAAVDVNDELTITYIRGEEDALSLTMRRERLEKGWNFLCQCKKCAREEAQSNFATSTSNIAIV